MRPLTNVTFVLTVRSHTRWYRAAGLGQAVQLAMGGFAAAGPGLLVRRPGGAVAVAEALVPELARSAGAVVTVRAAGACGTAVLAQPGPPGGSGDAHQPGRSP